jgi:hypothetical protein
MVRGVSVTLRASLALTAGLSLALARGSAAAAPVVGLSYTRGPGAEDCPDEAALRAAVAARLGEDPFGDNPTQRFDVDVAWAGGKFVGHVALADHVGAPSDPRQFEGATCTELVEALALALSLAIKPDLPVLAGPSPAPSEPATPPASPTVDTSPDHASGARAPARREPAPAPPNHDARSGFRFGGGVFGHGSFGTAPAPSLGGGPLLRASYGRGFVSLEGRFDLATGRPMSTGGAVETSLMGGELVPCWRFETLQACGVLLLGRLRGSVTGRDTPGRDEAFLAAVGGRAAFGQPLAPHVALEIRTDLLGLLTPIRLVRNGVTPVWSLSPVSLAAGLGVVAEIP